MTAPIRYNPCADGFPAKAWECLRRNREFLTSCNDWFEAHCPDDTMDVAQLNFPEESHPFHRGAFRFVMGFDPLLPGEDFPFLDVNNSWPDLEEEIRFSLHDGLLEEDACQVLIPDFFGINRLPSDISRGSDLKRSEQNFLSILKDQSITHDFIAVPKFVWNPRHKKEICRQVSEFLNEPCGTVKTIKPTGRTLGLEKEWDAFLCFEGWSQLGFVRGRAWGLAAWELLGKQDFGNGPNERKQRADEFLDSTSKEHKYVSDINRHVEKIEACIASVYPDFRPYGV